jgi:hypothetical protein
VDNANKGKVADEIYCPDCGAIIKRCSTFCMECGTELKEKNINATEVAKPAETNKFNQKTRLTAILLSIFFGFWSWLYTYKVDYKKFWIYLFLNLVVILRMMMLLRLFLIGMQDYTSPITLEALNTWVWMYILVNGSSVIWALINSIKRPEDFYINYPYLD